jgi:hypothetical protein
MPSCGSTFHKTASILSCFTHDSLHNLTLCPKGQVEHFLPNCGAVARLPSYATFTMTTQWIRLSSLWLSAIVVLTCVKIASSQCSNLLPGRPYEFFSYPLYFLARLFVLFAIFPNSKPCQL